MLKFRSVIGAQNLLAIQGAQNYQCPVPLSACPLPESCLDSRHYSVQRAAA